MLLTVFAHGFQGTYLHSSKEREGAVLNICHLIFYFKIHFIIYYDNSVICVDHSEDSWLLILGTVRHSPEE